MAKSQALIASELKVAALEARIAIATTVYHAQRTTIRDLEAKLATRGCVAPITTTHTIAPIITQFNKADGSVWEKTRLGNKATSRCIVAAQPTAAELSEERERAQADMRTQDIAHMAYHN
jgi:hypothetical protein